MGTAPAMLALLNRLLDELHRLAEEQSPMFLHDVQEWATEIAMVIDTAEGADNV